MIRFTWLQFRLRAAVALAALCAFAAVLIATGPHLAGLYTASATTGCRGGCTAVAAAQAFLSRLASPDTILYELGIVLVLVAPAITGIFWGAPLIAGELEAGTYRLAWTQGVSRTRWLAIKLAVTGLAAMAVTEALSLMLAWWAEPISKAISIGGAPESGFGQVRLGTFVFATSGITPLGYAAFGFALGTAVGTFIRRTVPAMAVTLAVFAAVQIAVPLWVRPHLIEPDRMVVGGSSFFADAAMSVGTLGATAVPGHPGALILQSGPIDAAGQPVGAIPIACLPGAPVKGEKVVSPDLGSCMASRGIREAITYQPASRYWPLQWIETGIFAALALALAGLCFWRLSFVRLGSVRLGFLRPGRRRT